MKIVPQVRGNEGDLMPFRYKHVEDPPCPEYAVKYVEAMSEWLAWCGVIVHEVDVICVPGMVCGTPEDCGFAVFLYPEGAKPDDSGVKLTINIATIPIPELEGEDDHKQMLSETFFHEVGHYFQWAVGADLDDEQADEFSEVLGAMWKLTLWSRK